MYGAKMIISETYLEGSKILPYIVVNLFKVWFDVRCVDFIIAFGFHLRWCVAVELREVIEYKKVTYVVSDPTLQQLFKKTTTCQVFT